MWLTLLFSALVSAAPLVAGEPGLVMGEEQFLRRPVPDLTMECVPEGSLPLSRLWNEKPLLLTLVFTHCSGICSPYVRFLKSAVDSVGGAGREYRVVVVSFDPQDQAADLARMARRLDLSTNPAWSFCVSSPGEIRRLSDAIGFWYRWDEARREFVHTSRLVAIGGGGASRVSWKDIPSSRVA